MAITRQFTEITIRLAKSTGEPTVTASAFVTDSDEGSASGAQKIMSGPAVLSLAAQLRDQIMQVASNAGKPLSF